jgi:phosphomevalonate kinase
MSGSTPPNLIIGLSGKPRSGKDTVAKMLLALFPGMVPLTFGNAIKEEYDAIHGTDTLHDERQKLQHRDAIQDLGDLRRQDDLYYWIRKTIDREPPFLLTDVRMPRELDAVWDAHGVMIRVESDVSIIRERMGEHFHQVHHANETQFDHIDEWDYVITNNGTLEELQAQVETVAAKIRKRYAEAAA